MTVSTQVALVTGAAQGLGNHIARRLHGAGYNVVLSDINLDAAQAAARELDASGDTAMAVVLNVANKGDFESALAAVLEQWGALHVLVNNAAVTRATPVMDISLEEFNEVVNINLGGTFAGCQVIGGYMASQGYGRVINMSSLAGQNGGTSTGAHYAASKGGILTLTKVFAKELAAGGVTVNAIAPGPIDSPMVKALVPAERLPGLLANIPAGKLGDADFIGDMVVQLARPEAYFTTGTTWDVNGGLFMR
ncbi:MULTISPECIES: SDR family NAD(P)-dependent oxidoreductase [unclassified Oceanobacter]|jgi:3-oxoacyl-[acyl-carrier protein] reductase|uniref:SDR family NAD(P)-dependent oxidoreductase n=1 Tax=unclassified Oceanobacter TaxID=2620260 RepID=UPI0027364981|nr:MULTISPECIES: SDR family NAD(P)-dependent oxidoreductase [unclassified Oceanobacter]MDP2504172.1 SDR family NAD(P)-dependent oxidoreductase [Oceanobacter sp. 3_MG-2023]MDP2546610.1 SDR family NAD(P)-dependent oxidoreductase [Oceanobacter sp. 4_MG-2023]MDP2610216.1 SDR family NAD(P)-dependent oxidoreductase [Oceanobacter sp. 1_MG-2023]MDP2613482.1 SDR family NAD(P)-dependent oxidoreductase [Oceanobacter sp. 2_MG-2023]